MADASLCAAIEEELVDFCDWMVDENNPNGLIVTDEMELIRMHPEYLELSSEPNEKERKTSHTRHNTMSSANTPMMTDAGSEGESQMGQVSAQRSPAFASPALSEDDDKDVDDLENDILDGMDEAPAEPGTQWTRVCGLVMEIYSAIATIRADRTAYQTDPQYLKLLPVREKLQKSLRDAERDVNDLTVKVNANSNIVVKV